MPVVEVCTCGRSRDAGVHEPGALNGHAFELMERVRVRKKVEKRPKTAIEIQERTAHMLREYCRLNDTQIRSEIDGLLQFAIEQRLKVRT